MIEKQRFLQSFVKVYGERYTVYPSSFISEKHNFFFLVKDNSEKRKYLVVAGSSDICKRFEGELIERPKANLEVEKGNLIKFAPTTHQNLDLLRELFPHLSPSTCSLRCSFGTGDRLGIATPSHIRAFEGKNIFPVLAQQSVRENERTERSFQEVLDSAIWGCFEAGYRGKFGADADHVKRVEDLKEAVECGYTMFTVDPSDFIKTSADLLTSGEKNEIYEKIAERKELERLYLGKTYSIKGEKFYFDANSFRDTVITYFDALKHIVGCYFYLKENKKGDFDFEVSVDETSLPTLPLAHIFIVEELRRRGVDFQNLALRFSGQWQKGIDYIGDVEKLGGELSIHANIAKTFSGYKLSLHSGSDKFSVYPLFAEKTEGLFHIKTSGTSWVEAVKVIAEKNPSLYREIHKFALKNFEKDRLSYHVTTDLSRIPDVEKISDSELKNLLDKPDSRQLIHITYGSILSAKSDEGRHLFRDKIYATLFKHEKEHYDAVSSHIRRHLDLLKN